MFRLLILVYLFVTITECKGQEHNRCTSKETCADCIGQGSMCAWCSQEVSMSWGKLRCDTMENLQKARCEKIVNPQNSVRNIRDLPLSMKGSREGEALQIKPQVIEVNLRPNSVQTFLVQYHQAVDHPVDLYLLMDLSYTMRDDKENLARLGQTLGFEMQSITSDFRLGFGSFVDKVVAPYSETHPRWIETPCQKGDCVRSYSFKNHMSLSSDITEFVYKVNDARVSANIDTPEGTLDAIMQAIVCKKEIGWRPKSRKLIVIATDEDFHYAGDGKMGGVIKPNDGKCHLDSRGAYIKSDQLDYPSLNQLKRKIKEHNVYLIFAVPQERMRHYQILSTRLTATTVGMLKEDSSNIVKLIREQYDKISSSIEMTETVQGHHNIKVSYYSQCLDGKWRKRNVCKGIKPGDTVTFEVGMEFSVCPKNQKDWRQEIEIHPVGLSDSLTVKLNMICKCDCAEDRGKEKGNRKKWCSGKGTYECGVCKCDGKAYGTACECDAEGNQTQSDSTACRYGNDEHECSNRGECRCGKCFCDERENPEEKYYGKYCECSNFNCNRRNQKFCNGQGICDCGICKCYPGWTGPDCGCITSIENCVLENGAEVCSGHGTCQCGVCNCGENYYGQFCEDCLTCPGKCEKYAACVECVLSAKGTPSELCASCEGSTVELADKIEVNETQKEKVCVTLDKDNCKITFKYRKDDNNFVTIQAQSTKVVAFKRLIGKKNFRARVRVFLNFDSEKLSLVKITLGCFVCFAWILWMMLPECPTAPDALVIASSTAGGVLFAGIVALLLVRILTELHDRREWARFQKDLDKARWDSGNNPIFIEPSSTFENPAFGKG